MWLPLSFISIQASVAEYKERQEQPMEWKTLSVDHQLKDCIIVKTFIELVYFML